MIFITKISLVKLWGNSGERRYHSVSAMAGNTIPLAYTTAVSGRGKRPSTVRWQLPTTQATEKNAR